ncbi:hypothetical protein [Chitinolyticbacter meiyuanensis]|uniref:hypothetical protein n=1 Tax=Chitinolyticbacter meiyuanensis TaxID=682798 RepID=UPI0011E5B377|nr:hypothetical protein [Chitinolyticbacter meiyuanensis]
MTEDHVIHALSLIQAISGIKLSTEQLAQLTSESRALGNAIAHWHGERSEAGPIAQALSQALLKQPWPTGTAVEKQGEFIGRLQAAADERGYDVVPIAD